MNILTLNYNLFEQNNIYYITNNDVAVNVTYSVFLIENLIETEIITPTPIVVGTNAEITFDSEAIYKIRIVADGEESNYDVRFFPTLKESIIASMKTAICDCSDITSKSCTTTKNTVVATELYKTQLVFNSTNLYRDLLLSPSFIRNYQYIFATKLDDKNVNLLTLLENAYSVLHNTGTTIDSVGISKLYLAYLYILFYSIEIDTVLYETGVDRVDVGLYHLDTDTEEVTAIKTLFDFETMKTCFANLDINQIVVHTNIFNYYTSTTFGIVDAFNWGNTNVSVAIGNIVMDAENVTYNDNENYDSVEQALNYLLANMGGLLYTPPIISNIVGGGTYELGSEITTVSLSWTIALGNVALVSQSLDEGIGDLDIAIRSYVHTGQSITSNRTYTLTISDGTTVVTANETISFLNKRYWGTSALTTLDDAAIIALSSELSSTRVQTRTMDASGGKYLYFAMPTSFGCDVNKFKIGGLFNSDWQVTTRNFTNSNGHIESYDIFRSTGLQTGATINVEII